MTDCKAELYLEDDVTHFVTLRCSLEEGHKGPHQECYTTSIAGTITVTWDKDNAKVPKRKRRMGTLR